MSDSDENKFLFELCLVVLCVQYNIRKLISQALGGKQMKKFYLGLDIGTDSVGIACTDENYDLLRIGKKDLWAVRLFDPANDAKKRRTYRSVRTRLARRKLRIGFLQEVFAPFIGDETFFMRLKYSDLYEEDKPEGLPRVTLFADDNYTDKQFNI